MNIPSSSEELGLHVLEVNGSAAGECYGVLRELTSSGTDLQKFDLRYAEGWISVNIVSLVVGTY